MVQKLLDRHKIKVNVRKFVLSHMHAIDFFFTERGVVWEETIILLPDNVHYVFLSATIPNARQFAEWISHLHKQVSHNNIYYKYT